MRVSISAGDRHVTITTKGGAEQLRRVEAAALRLFAATAPSQAPPSAPFGYTVTSELEQQPEA